MERVIQYMDQMRPRVEDALDDLLPHAEKSPATLHEAMRYSVLGGGKRLRPLLVLMAARACMSESEECSDALLHSACATELAHTYSLIHDDLPAMDDDNMRRGRLTCHKAYNEATAILAGDALLTMSFEVLASNMTTERAATAIVQFARALGNAGMVGGQMLDLEGNADSGTMEQLRAIHRWKTGSLIAVCCALGGLFAKANDEKLSALKEYGQALGLLFQITDDILDVESTAETLGKTVGKDQVQNKLTYPALVGLDESKKLAQDAAVRAKTALKPFGKEALMLRLLADLLIDRKA